MRQQDAEPAVTESSTSTSSAVASYLVWSVSGAVGRTVAGVTDEGGAMKHTRRLSLLAAALVVLASTLALQAVAGPPNPANRFEATFDETNVSVTNRIADLGVFQLINTGTGTVEGLGEATVTVSVTQDRSVQPCGPGSWTNAGIRRIGLDGGVLVVRELVHVCQTDSGPVGTGSWEVDGPSSTGIFSDARGSGEVRIVISSGTSTLSGSLKLVGENGS